MGLISLVGMVRVALGWEDVLATVPPNLNLCCFKESLVIPNVFMNSKRGWKRKTDHCLTENEIIN